MTKYGFKTLSNPPRTRFQKALFKAIDKHIPVTVENITLSRDIYDEVLKFINRNCR